MTEAEFDAKLAEVDRLLNDPEVHLDPERVWTLLAEVSGPATPPAHVAPGPLAGIRPAG